MRTQLFILSLGTIIVCLGCSKKEEKLARNIPDPSRSMSEPLVGAANEVTIGLDVCDEFLRKYRNCVAQLPEDMQASLQKGLDRTERAWKTLVESSTDQKMLRDSCQQMEASTSKAMRAQGCSW